MHSRFPLLSTTTSVCFNTFLGDSQLWVFWAPCHHAFLKIGCSTCLFRVILGKSTKRAHMCFFLLPLCRSSPASCWSSESITVLCKDGDFFFFFFLISWSLEAGNIKYLHSSSFCLLYIRLLWPSAKLCLCGRLGPLTPEPRVVGTWNISSDRETLGMTSEAIHVVLLDSRLEWPSSWEPSVI